ncbi:hypothetical protein Hypma_015050 [Hypsizygus marmoreus]|uniref:DUF7704 domain-containing protein n=1 Tax=Hypsizygus marmoreus TaxID=39966 RepID=A0A369K6Z0_HYPMA|nr:hypothetical protein Hypma_015050 [Hypsizygus marmoreus]
MSSFSALPGFYNFMFLYLEPLSTIGPAISCLIHPGTQWFYHELVPSGTPAPATAAGLDPRTITAVWQLANCYFLLGLTSTVVFRAIRDALPNNPVAQERILGASLGALAVADLTHIFSSLLALPPDIRFDFGNWNTMTHGNISAVLVLFLSRMAWFAGVGRTRYWFGQRLKDEQKKKS